MKKREKHSHRSDLRVCDIYTKNDFAYKQVRDRKKVKL